MELRVEAKIAMRKAIEACAEEEMKKIGVTDEEFKRVNFFVSHFAEIHGDYFIDTLNKSVAGLI